jgi:cell division protein FtsQ
LLTALVVGLLVFAGWAVFFSSWLALRQVDVAGTSMVSEREVVRAASVSAGTPLARVDLGDVRRQVAAIPAVADVTVHRSWPHTLQITVSERTPSATVRRDGSWYAMDDAGVLFHPTKDRDPKLPVVVLAPSADAAARQEVASVVAALPDDIVSSMRRVRATSVDSITLTLRDGREVRWGSADESDRKVQVLAILLKQDASEYDVSVPELPTTRR